LRVLSIEDNPDDYAMLVRHLQRGGYVVAAHRVETREALIAALREPWDIVFSDWMLPGFTGLDALAVCRELGADLPFIVVSGTIGEELAVDALRGGAADFILKDRLARLLPAVARELHERGVRAEHRRVQEQLVISDRMASIGLLAAGVAHEINNPLAAAMSNLELATMELQALVTSPQLSAISEEIGDARTATLRIRDIVRDLKLFSRAADETSGAIDLHRVLESTLRMASNEVRHRASVVRELAPVPQVDGNESRVGQVFLNLIVNAAQSIPPGNAKANTITVATRTGPDGWPVVEIRDTGCGMAPEVRDRIFTPFFTTKGIGEGTGLGLSICHRIVTGIGGTITVESEVGRGTTFEVRLPPSSRAVIRDTGQHTATSFVRRGRILVIDDEQLVTNALYRLLRSSHEVVIEQRGREALERIRNRERFDVILCDLMMPEVTGMQLCDALRAEAPDQAAAMIFLTGGAFSPEARAFLDRVRNPRIEKPFTLPALTALINERLR